MALNSVPGQWPASVQVSTKPGQLHPGGRRPPCFLRQLVRGTGTCNHAAGSQFPVRLPVGCLVGPPAVG